MHVTGFRSRSRHVVHFGVGMFDFWPARCMKKRLICHERPLHRRLKYEVRSLLLLTKGVGQSRTSVAKCIPEAHDVSYGHFEKSTSFFSYFVSLSGLSQRSTSPKPFFQKMKSESPNIFLQFQLRKSRSGQLCTNHEKIETSFQEKCKS